MSDFSIKSKYSRDQQKIIPARGMPPVIIGHKKESKEKFIKESLKLSILVFKIFIYLNVIFS